jgi:hypothetical protein
MDPMKVNVNLDSFVELITKYEVQGVFRSLDEERVTTFQAAIQFKPLPLVVAMTLDGFKDDPVLGATFLDQFQKRSNRWTIDSITKQLVAQFSTKLELIQTLEALGASSEVIKTLKTVKVTELHEVLDNADVRDADTSIQTSNISRSHRQGFELNHPLAKVAKLRVTKGNYSSLLYQLSIPWGEVLDKLADEASKRIMKTGVPVFTGRIS